MYVACHVFNAIIAAWANEINNKKYIYYCEVAIV